MKIISSIGFLVLCLTACKIVDRSQPQIRPNNEVINEVLYYVSIIDSFNQDYSISENIVIPILYQHGKIDPDSVSYFAYISYAELFLCFDSYDSLKLRQNDSLFIESQFDSIEHVKLTEQLKSKFNQNSNYRYQFNLPIFNSSMNQVEVSYIKYGNDTLFKQQMLVRNDSGWVEKRFNYIPNIIE